ncbi:MAG TPA: hypothetical protein VEH31_28360, partial [Streptosporangiaceae bacterium]|nr:hypothetical protein [Streptosporangiaceae bacterium]
MTETMLVRPAGHVMVRAIRWATTAAPPGPGGGGPAGGPGPAGEGPGGEGPAVHDVCALALVAEP